MVQADIRNEPLVVLLGATATGKTEVSVQLAQRLPLEVVNCDASQVYRGMNIGTAKPTPEERAGIPHHLFDVVEPDDPMDAGRYVEQADAMIREVRGRDAIPLFVGGTGLYVKALLRGLARMPEVPLQTRHDLADQLRQEGLSRLYEELVRVDPDTASALSAHDTQRILRALEVYRTSGRPISDSRKQHGFCHERPHVLKIGLLVPRQELQIRIEQRVPQMWDRGFADEVRGLMDRGFSERLRTFKALGYREVAACLRGELSRVEAVGRIVTQHKKYAKRQETWFKREPDVHWFSPVQREEIFSVVGRFVRASCV